MFSRARCDSLENSAVLELQARHDYRDRSEGKEEMKPVSLQDEIENAKNVVEMYRNSWFMPVRSRADHCSRLRWAGEPEDWRLWLAANATLRRLKKLR